jgi:hypothetical protein
VKLPAVPLDTPVREVLEAFLQEAEQVRAAPAPAAPAASLTGSETP